MAGTLWPTFFAFCANKNSFNSFLSFVQKTQRQRKGCKLEPEVVFCPTEKHPIVEIRLG